ncbi:MAG: DUF2795 domain-containing protein [Candidatus Bathyarchaeia archaeon]|jgi:hypothetical protein
MARRKGIGQGRGSRKQYTSRSVKPGHVSPAIVEKYLAGIHFPAEKKALVDIATGKKAPEDVMDMLGKLPNKTYKSPIDITKEIGKIE